MELKARYAAWLAREDEILKDGDENYDTFAFRGDGVMVCLEQSGRYFEIVNTGPGRTPDEGRPTDAVYVLRDPVSRRTESAYIEPIWFASYFDILADFAEEH